MTLCKTGFCALAFVAIAQMAAFSARADLNEQQPLNFGRWVVTANDTEYSITINPDGSFVNSPSFIMLEPPQEGIYQITDLPPFAQILSVDVTMLQPMEDGSGPFFEVTNFQVIAPNADGAGETLITLGATATTSGDGAPYDDSVYNGTLELDIQL